METNIVVVCTNCASFWREPVTQSEWQGASSAIVLVAVALVVGALYRLMRRSFAGWETD